MKNRCITRWLKLVPLSKVFGFHTVSRRFHFRGGLVPHAGRSLDRSRVRGIVCLSWLLLFALWVPRASALSVTGYDSVTNNRFVPEGSYTNTISNPAYNLVPNTNTAFLGYGYDFSGVGWDDTNYSTYASYGLTLITPENTLQASHLQNSIQVAMFQGRNGQVLAVQAPGYGGGWPTTVAGTDIAIGNLNSYMPASNFTIYPLMDLGSNPANYVGSSLMMYGWWSRVGTNYVASASSTYFTSSSATNAPSMAYVQGGDSGSPDFIPYVDPITGAKGLSVLGAHYLSNGTDPFTPAYGTNINAIINATGYTLKWVAPVAQTWTGGAGSGDFTNSVNWSSAMPGISNAVLFDIGTAGGQTVINLGGTQTLNGLYFKNSGGNGFTISNGLLAVDRVGIVNGSNGTLTVQSGVALTAPQIWNGGSGGIVVNGDVTNNGNLWVLDGTGTNRINGSVYGTGGLAKDGAGRLIVSGTNILVGSVWAHAGTLELQSPFLSSTGSLYINGSLLLQGGTNAFGGSLYGGGGSVQGSVWDVSLNGGLLVVSNGIQIGSRTGSTGSFTMNGGQLVTTNSGAIDYVGNASVGVMTVSNGTWWANQVKVGNSAGLSGTLNISGGTNNILANGLTIGSLAGATGVVNLTSGQLVTTNGAGEYTTVGNGGVGAMTVSGGRWLANYVNVGSGSGASGTLTINGGTNLFNIGYWMVGASAGATGNLFLTGGQLVTTNSAGNENSYLGNGGVGGMTVSGGQWLADRAYVGEGSGIGTLTINGGSSLLSLYIADGIAGSTGNVFLTGGQLVTTNSGGGGFIYLGNNGVGTMTVSGGQWLGNAVRVGNNAGSSGTLNLSGGTNIFNSGNALVVAYAAGATGAVNLTGGQLVTTNSAGNAVLSVGGGGVGSMTVSGGQWLANSVNVGNSAGSSGILTLSGGTNLFSSTLANYWMVGPGAGSTGNVFLTGGQLVTTNSVGNESTYLGNGGVGVMTVSNGQWLANSVTLGSAATGNGTLSVAGGQVVATSVVAGGVAASSNNTVRVTGGGVLEANSLSITAGSVGNVISNSGGVYQFGASAPTITPASGSIVLNGGTISFRGIANANVKGNWSGSQLTNIAFYGANTFRLNAASNTTSGQDYTFGTGLGATNYVGLEMINGATAWRGGSLTIGNGGTLLVSNTAASIAGVVTNSGRMTVMNGVAVYGGNVFNQGAYVSDPSTNTFNGNFTVGPTATVTAAAGDVYAFGSNFVMSSTNRVFDMHLAQAVFADSGYGITTATSNHTFSLTGSGAVDMGAVGMNVAQLATNFSIGTLSIVLSNNLTVTGTKTGSLTNALYVGWLDLSAWNTNAGVSLTNTLQAALTLPDINLYYDMSDSRNAYLQDASYALWGGGGLLIPIPEPSVLTLTLAAGVFSAFILRRRKK